MKKEFEKFWCGLCGRRYMRTLYGMLRIHRLPSDQGERSNTICQGSYTVGCLHDPRKPAAERVK